jgi:hypothetical protein
MKKKHTITTTNPIMQDIGLGSFSTGILYDWVTEQNGANLINITPNYWDGFFDEPNDPLAAMRHILTQNVPDVTGGEQFYIKTTRPKGRTFENKTFYWMNASSSDWDYNIGNFSYSFRDLKIDDFSSNNPKEYSDIMTRLIHMNEWVSNKLHINQSEYIPRSLFFRDIRLSENKGIMWTNHVDIRLPGSTQVCTIPVEWKLIFHTKTPRRTHTVATKNPTFAIPNQNSLGQKSGGRDDTGRQIGSKQAAGELDLFFDPVSGKVRAGNKTVMAVMTTNVAAAIDVDGKLEATPEEYRDNKTGPQGAKGRARPIMMKDGNPFNWGPEYKYKNSCGLTEDEKNELYDVPVINMFPNVSFVKGEHVMLTDNGGSSVWQPLKVGSTDAPPVIPEVGGWEFMYMASNCKHYFRSLDNTKISPTNYEAAIQDLYYAYINSTPPKNPDSAKITNVADNGYVQLTSFDFMGPQVGGLRNKHALGNTQIGARTDKEETNNIADNLVGDITSPFFGCVFPGGYETGDKYDEYTIIPLSESLTSTNTNYIKKVDRGVLPFESGNSSRINADPARGPGDIFGKFTDLNVKNLPADIALNADPASTNGAPIPILKGIHNATKYLDSQFDDHTKSLQHRLNELLANEDQRWAWLKNVEDKPAYDFIPLDKTTVQFRPLKAEVYASLEININSIGKPTNNPSTKIKGRLASSQWVLLNDNKGPISDKVLERAGTGGIIGPHGVGDKKCFAYGIKDNLPNLASDNVDYPERYWNRQFQGDWLGNNSRPGGAFGVIGAKCTVTATNGITFQTENKYGMDDWKSAGTQTLPFHINNSSFRNGEIDSQNCTEMFVRVFHAHPRHLTVYDPRYFAVHHFADGVGDDVIETTYHHGNSEITKEQYDNNVQSSGVGYPDKFYQSNELTYSNGVDVRVPTLIGNSGVNNEQATGVISTVGTLVYSDDEYREVTDWQVKNVHRGNLLPSEVDIETIGVSIYQIEIDPDTGLMGGSGYKLSDRFTTEGGNGEGVILKATSQGGLGSNGEILQLEVHKDNFGFDFQPSNFFPKKDVDDLVNGNPSPVSYDLSKVKIVPTGTVSGKGLRAYVATGAIYKLTSTQPRPSVATKNSISKITGSVPTHNGRLSNVFNPMYGANDVTSVEITNPSIDNKYDVFLHFHNDISHTWGNSDLAASTPSAREQVIQLTIAPDGSASSSASSSSSSFANRGGNASGPGFNSFTPVAFNPGTSALGNAGGGLGSLFAGSP